MSNQPTGSEAEKDTASNNVSNENPTTLNTPPPSTDAKLTEENPVSKKQYVKIVSRLRNPSFIPYDNSTIVVSAQGIADQLDPSKFPSDFISNLPKGLLALTYEV